MTDKKPPHAKAEELADQDLDQAHGGGTSARSTSSSETIAAGRVGPKPNAKNWIKDFPIEDDLP